MVKNTPKPFGLDTMGKKTPKRFRLLNSMNGKKMTVQNRAISDANAADSPLLLLPPEVRTCIYHAVLGDREIHITADEFIVRHQVCSQSMTLREEVKSIVEAGTEIGQRTWQHHHHFVGEVAEPRTLLDIKLLRVCRQIHAEAALIPFSSNSFSFSSGEPLHHFARHLIAEQREAIRSIGFILGNRADIWHDEHPDKLDLKRLAGVKHLTVVADIATPYNVSRVVVLNKQDYFDWIGKIQKEGGFESVVIAITAEAEFNESGGRVASKGDFQAETRELERKLMKRPRIEVEPQAEEEDGEYGITKETPNDRQISRAQRGLRKVKTQDWANIIDEELGEDSE